MTKKVYEKIIEEMKEYLSIQIPYELKEKNFEKINQNKLIGANINIVGEEQCEFYIFGEKELFFEIAKKNHGFEVPEEVIPSYVGELWNFVLAPIIKKIKRLGVEIDISHSVPLTDIPEEVNHDEKISYEINEGKSLVGNLNIYMLDLKKGDK